MWNIIHILLGALIGKEINSYFLVFIIALVTHFLLDHVPHWDGDYGKEGFFKGKGFNVRKGLILFYVCLFLIGAFITLKLTLKENNPRILFGALISASPDLANLFYKNKNKYYQKYLNFHTKIQREARFLVGFPLQLLITLVLIFLLVR